MSLETPGGLWADIDNPSPEPLTEELIIACGIMLAQNYAQINAVASDVKIQKAGE